MYLKLIQQSIDHIEENLFYDISLDECAKAAGYSVFHYCRIFHSLTNITVMDYIRKRRVSEAVKKINETKKPLKEIAFDCGFNSQENFVRVFKSMFGILPTDYRSTKYSLFLFDKIILSNSSYELPEFYGIEEPKIVTLPSFKVAGKKYKTTFENNNHFSDVPIFWNRFYAEKLYEQINKDYGQNRVDYGLTILNDEGQDLYSKNNERNNLSFYYLTATKIDNITDVPEEFDIVHIPSRTYAVFKNPKSTDYDLIDNLRKTWIYIDFCWLPNSIYVHAGNYEFNEYYPFKDRLSKNIYIPLEEKN